MPFMEALWVSSGTSSAAWSLCVSPAPHAYAAVGQTRVAWKWPDADVCFLFIFDPSGLVQGRASVYFWQVCVCFLRNELTSQGLPNSVPELCCDWEAAGSHSGGP